MTRLVVFLLLLLTGCRDPRELVEGANVTIIVINLDADELAIIDVGGEHREAGGEDDEIAEVRLTLTAPGEHAGTVEVREDDGDDARCGTFVIGLPDATSTDSVAIDVEQLARCVDGEGEGEEGEGEEGEGEEGEGEEGEGEGAEGEGEGEGEGGEGEGEVACSGTGECDDGVACTLQDRCLGGVCIGVYDASASCGACEGIICGEVCDACCVPQDDDCDETACGVCLGDCDGETCTCDSAACAQTGEAGATMRATCVDGASCRQRANGSTSAIIDCFAGATCATELDGVTSALITCEQSSCEIDARNSEIDVRCDDTEQCLVASDSSASLTCGEASCSLDCGLGECDLACGPSASCTLDCDAGAACTLSCSEGATSCDLDCGATNVPCAPGSECFCD